MKPKYLKDKDPWMLAEDIPDCDVFFFQIPMSCFTSDNSYPFVQKYKKVVTHYRKFHMDFYFGERDSFEVGESIVNALFARRDFGKDVNRNVVDWSNKLIKYARDTSRLPLAKYANTELWRLYEEHDKIHTKLYTYGWLPVACDMFHNNFTDRLKKYLRSACGSLEAAEKAFITLTTPSKKSIVAEEREELLKIYGRFGRRFNNPKLLAALDEHAKKWGHFGYIFVGNVKPFDAKHYLGELREAAKTGQSAKSLLDMEAKKLRETRKKQSELYRKLKMPKLYRGLFETAQDFALTKLVRRHAQLFTAYKLHQTLLPEIAKRLKLTRYQVQFMLKDEVKSALIEGKLLSRKIINARLKECALYTEKNFETIFIGKDLANMKKGLKTTVDTKVSQLLGQTAQPGYARGRVKIVIRAQDMKKFKVGDILVSIATDPDIVPAMKKAAAIVTEQGGITSHAAIVSRELGVPCVIGTKIATKVFKDGDMVEVEATKGIIRKL